MIFGTFKIISSIIKLNIRCWYYSECLDESLNHSGKLVTTFCNVVFSWVLCQDSWHTPCLDGFCILGPGVLLLNNIFFVGKNEIRGCPLITQYKFGFLRDSSPLCNIVIREALLSEKCSFFEHCSKGLWPPSPLLFEHLSYFAGGVFCWGGN